MVSVSFVSRELLLPELLLHQDEKVEIAVEALRRAKHKFAGRQKVLKHAS